MAQKYSSSREASGVRSGLPDCRARPESRILVASLQSQQPITPLLTSALGAENLGLGSRFELSLVSTWRFSRRPELVLLIGPQAIDPWPEDALHDCGSASVGLRSIAVGWNAQPAPKLALLTLAGPLAALSPHCKPPDPVGMDAGVPFSQVTLKAGLLAAPTVTFLFRPLAQGTQDSPPNLSPGFDLGPREGDELGNLGFEGRGVGPFPGQIASLACA